MERCLPDNWKALPQKETTPNTGIECVVPENIHTPPTEGFLILYPPPPWNFHSKG